MSGAIRPEQPPPTARCARGSWPTGLLTILVLSGCVGQAPTLRAGLWEVRVQTLENPGGKRADFNYRLCRDPAYDRRAERAERHASNCETRVQDLGNGRFQAASRCLVDGVRVVSRGSSIYPSAMASHSETQATYTPEYFGKSDERMTQDQRYLGACPAGIKPGDRIMPDGRLVKPSASQ